MADKITITINPENWTASIDGPKDWTVEVRPFQNGRGMHMCVRALDIASAPDPHDAARRRQIVSILAGAAGFLNQFIAAEQQADRAAARPAWTADDSEPDDGPMGPH